MDDREPALHRALQVRLDATSHRRPPKRELTLGKERLVLGDVAIRSDEDPRVSEVLVERKRHDDLLHSRFDGRLAEQSERLARWRDADPSRWTLLVVEGHPPDGHPRAGFFVKLLLAEALRSHATPRSALVRTAGVDETAAIVCTAVKTIREHLGPADASVEDGGGDPGITVVAPPPRRSAGNIFLRQLCCVPGISADRARRIEATYPGRWPALLAAVDRDPDGTAERLAGIVRHRPAARCLVDELRRATADPITAPSVPSPQPPDDAATTSVAAVHPRRSRRPAVLRGPPRPSRRGRGQASFFLRRDGRTPGRIPRSASSTPDQPPKRPRFFHPHPGSDRGEEGVGVDQTSF